MPDRPRFLITTSDKRSWRSDLPVLFLGEWCRLYHDAELWMAMEAIMARPYGSENAQKEYDSIYVSQLHECLLLELSDILNLFHKSNHSVRYWRMVLGQWLYRYTSVLFNRWHTLEQAFQNYKISATIIFDANSYCLASPDSNLFIWACNDDFWNHMLYSKILNCLSVENLEIKKIDLDNKSSFELRKTASIQKDHRFKQLMQKSFTDVLPKLSRDGDAFIINSYLSKKNELKLQLMFAQIPQWWRTPELKPVKPNLALRREIMLKATNHCGFKKFVRMALMEIIPVCYLEGYPSLLKQVDSLPWPRKPKFIFTSNNFDTDEIFKVWAASKVADGVPYFTGQHGNNYGTLKHSSSETECISTSDRFLTWGWTDENPKYTPAFIFKTAGKKKPKTNDKGGALFIQLCLPHRIYHWDNYAEFVSFQNEQFQFVEQLPTHIRQQLSIRLHAEYRKHLWADEERWKDRIPDIKIEDGSANITTLISENRLVIHAYDSTGILETLALNIPTLCFWRGGLDHLRNNAKPYYEHLIQAQILFNSPILAAKKMATIWDSIDEWWNGSEVQTARKIFCDRYARMEKKPIRTLKRLLFTCASYDA